MAEKTVKQCEGDLATAMLDRIKRRFSQPTEMDKHQTYLEVEKMTLLIRAVYRDERSREKINESLHEQDRVIKANQG